MTKASDVAKKKQQLAKQLKLVCNETGKPREKDIVAVVRGAVRKAWMRSPVKLSLSMKNAVHVEDVPKHLHPKRLTKNSKWLYQCAIGGDWHIGSNIVYDHIIGEHSCKSYEDFKGFCKSILDVGWSDLQQLCKACHDIKTYSERYGVTYEEAKSLKPVIAITKTTAAKQKKWLSDRGVKPASNQEGRTKQITDVLNKEGMTLKVR